MGDRFAALGDAKQQVEWFGTVRPRVGFALDRTLLYVTGGLAYGNQKLSIPGYASGTSTDIGWTAGAGAEYAFTNNVTAKLEGLYVDLGKSDLVPAAPVNKTGTDAGVRSEVGVLRGPRAGVTYAVSTYFDDTTLPARLAVIDGMRSVGLDLLEYVF